MAEKNGYRIDITFVIDATGDMRYIMDDIKRQVLEIPNNLTDGLREFGKTVKKMRVNLIDFADYQTEGKEAIRQTGFFDLPENQKEFEEAVLRLNFEGRGGDAPENAFEALYCAMQADWTQEGGRNRRHIITLISNAAPHLLGERETSESYPKKYYPTSSEEMEAIWNERDVTQNEEGNKKRCPIACNQKSLLLYVPKNYLWDDVGCWKNTYITYIDNSEDSIDLSGVVECSIADIFRV